MERMENFSLTPDKEIMENGQLLTYSRQRDSGPHVSVMRLKPFPQVNLMRYNCYRIRLSLDNEKHP